MVKQKTKKTAKPAAKTKPAKKSTAKKPASKKAVRVYPTKIDTGVSKKKMTRDDVIAAAKTVLGKPNDANEVELVSRNIKTYRDSGLLQVADPPFCFRCMQRRGFCQCKAGPLSLAKAQEMASKGAAKQPSDPIRCKKHRFLPKHEREVLIAQPSDTTISLAPAAGLVTSVPVAAPTVTKPSLADRMQENESKPAPKSDRKPTPEQQAILDKAVEMLESGEDGVLVVEAGAGTGKTSSLRMLADVLKGVGQYTAFNAAPVNENKEKFSGTKVSCNTTHSLAFRAEGKRFSHRLGGQRVRAHRIASMLGIEELSIQVGEMQETPLSPKKPVYKNLVAGFLATQIMGAVRRFCQGADTEITEDCFKYIDGIDKPTEDGRRTYANNQKVRGYLLPYAQALWKDYTNPEGLLPGFSHDTYLKLWQMNHPVIAADYLLLDEAQDSGPCLLDIVGQQNMLRVVVGDSAQQIYCQPAGTLVQVPVKAGGGRGKGGPHYGFASLPIETLKPGQSVVTWNRNWRNGGVRKQGCKISEINTREFDGSLVVVSTSGEESRYAPDHHCIVLVGDALDKKHVVYLMRRGEQYRVGRCLWRHPSQNNTNGVIRRAAAEGADAFWVLSSHDRAKDAALAEALVQHDFNIPDMCFREGSGKYRVPVDEFWKRVGANDDKAEKCLAHFGRLITHPLWETGAFQKFCRGPIVTAAANLMYGMRALAVKNAKHRKRITITPDSCWTPIRVRRERYVGVVYSLCVEKDHTYVADGIVTHNSWRGAVNALGAFPNAPRLFLTQSFRFGNAIADIANQVLATLPDIKLRLKGLSSIPSRIVEVADPRCVLCRTNACAVARLLNAITEGKKPYLVGGGSDVIAFVRAAEELQSGRSTSHPDLACFSSWKEVQEYAGLDEGEDLKLLVKLIDEFGCQPILSALESMPAEEDADLVISTAHRSKGREWDTVQLAPDFPTLSKATDEDRRLLYVAVTRAKLELDISECPFFNGDDSLDTSSIIANQGKVSDRAQSIVPPTPSAPPAPNKFTFAKGRSGDWMVRGPRGHQDKTVDVERRDGSSCQKRLGVPVWEDGAVALYRIS